MRASVETMTVAMNKTIKKAILIRNARRSLAWSTFPPNYVVKNGPNNTGANAPPSSDERGTFVVLDRVFAVRHFLRHVQELRHRHPQRLSDPL